MNIVLQLRDGEFDMSCIRKEEIDMNKERYLQEMTERTRLFLSDSDQDKIKRQTVAQAGFGGIGAIVLELLARMGVMRFRLLDMDTFEMSNMNRQILATTKTMGEWKVDVAAARIKEINPYAEVEMLIREKANKENAEKLIKGSDIFILETDSPSSELLFHEVARKYAVPVVDGHCIAVSGGAVQVFDYRNRRQVCRNRPFKTSALNWIALKILGQRKKLDDITDEDLEQLDIDHEYKGVPTAAVNFVTNMLGCLVVAEIIKLITGIGKTYLYPKEIYVSPIDLKMKIRSARSFGHILFRSKRRLLKGKESSELL